MSFYKMERGWMDSPMFAGEEYSPHTAWAWLIESAAWEDGYKNILGKRVFLKRGQLSHSIRFMAEKFQWSNNKVIRFLERLQEWSMIDTDSNTGQNIITICNYSKYQDNKRKTNTASNTEADTPTNTGSNTGTNTKIKNLRNKEVKEKNIIPKPEDISESVWEDFKTHRAAKKAAITQTVIDGIRREAEKAGMPLEEVIREICVRNWQGVKAEWLTKGKENGNSNSGTGDQNKSERARRAAYAGLVD